MANFDSLKAVFTSRAEQLSKIMNLDEAAPNAWAEEDLPAMLRHQMSAPLEFDLSSLELGKSEEAARDQTLSAADACRIRSFQDLFEHPAPPLALLKWAKDFFKQQAGTSANRRPEQEVAYLFYLLAIVISRVRLGTSITTLTDADLQKALKWAISRKWLDANTKEMCVQARRAFHGGTTG
jgi:hypothetical protein